MASILCMNLKYTPPTTVTIDVESRVKNGARKGESNRGACKVHFPKCGQLPTKFVSFDGAL